MVLDEVRNSQGASAQQMVRQMNQRAIEEEDQVVSLTNQVAQLMTEEARRRNVDAGARERLSNRQRLINDTITALTDPHKSCTFTPRTDSSDIGEFTDNIYTCLKDTCLKDILKPTTSSACKYHIYKLRIHSCEAGDNRQVTFFICKRYPKIPRTIEHQAAITTELTFSTIVSLVEIA